MFKKKIMHVLKTIIMSSIILGLYLAQTACGSSSGSGSYLGGNSKSTYDVDDAYLEEEYDGEFYDDETSMMPNETTDASDNYLIANKGSSTASNENIEGEKDVPEAKMQEKLVYTCNMSIETTDYQETLGAIKDLISKYDGIIGSESYTDSARDWYYSNYEKRTGTMTAQLSIRVPSKNYQDFLDGIEGHGKITQSNQNVENITRRYSETETTIKSLETQEDRLLEMMENASTIEEMITVEDRLTEVQNELMILRNRLADMDTDVTYSTVNIEIREVVEYTPDEEPVHTLTFKDRLKNTIKNSWDNLLSFLENFLFFLIEATPILLILGVFGLAIFGIIFGCIKANRKRAAKKQAKAVAVPTQPVQTQPTEKAEREQK